MIVWVEVTNMEAGETVMEERVAIIEIMDLETEVIMINDTNDELDFFSDEEML